MRTFLRVSLLGNAFIDLACIIFLLHGSGHRLPDATFSSEPVEQQAVVDSHNPIGVFTGAAPLVPGELPGSYPTGLLAGNTVLAELVQFGGIPRFTASYEVGRLNWRFEGVAWAFSP